MCIILYCMYCLTAVLLQCLVSPLFLHTAPASKACKTHFNLFLKLLVAEDLRWGGAPQWGHREILFNQNQSALLVFLTGNFSTALSSSLFRRKEDFFTWVNLKANLVLALLLSPGLQWAQWPTGSLCLYMQQVFSWCFQTKACTSLKREELQVVRRTILLPVLRGTSRNPEDPTRWCSLPVKENDEEEERAEVLSRWLIPREECQTGNLEGQKWILVNMSRNDGQQSW